MRVIEFMKFSLDSLDSFFNADKTDGIYTYFFVLLLLFFSK